MLPPVDDSHHFNNSGFEQAIKFHLTILKGFDGIKSKVFNFLNRKSSFPSPNLTLLTKTEIFGSDIECLYIPTEFGTYL